VPTPGFPQSSLAAHPLGRLLLIDAGRCAAGILAAADRGRAEVVLPARYRLPAAIEGLAPGLVARLAANRTVARFGSGASETAS
jgi:hypothetical protein